MAKASVTIGSNAAPDECMETEMVIVGGGICSILAAKMCSDRGWPYQMVDRNEDLGGVWSTMANDHSYLQAYEPNYRWDARYRLSTDELTKGSGLAVHQSLKKYAYDHQVDKFTRLGTEVLTVKQQPDGSFLTIAKHMKSGKVTHIKSAYLCICCGILATQVSPEERGVRDVDKFKGIACYGGKHNGVNSAVGRTDLTGKKVVIMGTGSFALEAAEAAGRGNAQSITLVSRPRHRWVLPFSRQYTVTAVSFLPLVSWPLKVKLVQWYLRRNFFKPCGLANVPPTGRLDEQDWGGQCNDGVFRLAAEGRLKVVVGKVERLEANSVVLAKPAGEEGEAQKLPADMFVTAAGCRYNLSPPFLHALGVGFGDIHNYCFMGRNPRIGTASDFVFAYVPLGPQTQLNMFFHAVEQIKAGREWELSAAMFPTPLGASGKTTHTGGRMAGHTTWFAYRHWWSTKNIAMEERERAFLAVQDVGRSIPARIAMRLAMGIGQWINFATAVRRSIRELWSFKVYGPGVTDHYHPPAPLFREKKEA